MKKYFTLGVVAGILSFSGSVIAEEIRIPAQIIDSIALSEKIGEHCEKFSKEKPGLVPREKKKQLQDVQGKKLALSPSAQKNTPKDVYDSVAIITGGYKCGRCPKWHILPWAATAWVAHEDGYVVTNNHVIERMPENAILVIYFPDGSAYSKFDVVAADKKRDIAVLKLDAKFKHPLRVVAEEPPIGSRLHLISHPEGYFYYYTTGHVSSYAYDKNPKDRKPWMFTTCDYAVGSSGGAFFNNQCEIVGMVSSTSTIFSSKEANKQPQMVIHRSVPASALREILYGKK